MAGTGGARSGRLGGRPAPRIPAMLTAHDGSALEPERDHDAVAFSDQDFSDQDGVGIRFSGCTFGGCVLDRTDLTRSSLRDVTFERLRAVGAELGSSRWFDVVVGDSLLAVPQLYDAQIERVLFVDCKLQAANFADAVLTDVTFERCSLAEVDFSRATLRRVSFSGSRLEGADLTGATLDEADLRGCDLGIERGFGALSGRSSTGSSCSRSPPRWPRSSASTSASRTRAYCPRERVWE
jgi:uncharacterized protein YjbI with pentapeptide repeats